MDSIVKNITDRFQLIAGNSLEEYRCDTFFTKEPETVQWIETFINDHDIFYDIGANIGIYSIYSGIIHPNLRVFSFEPFRRNFIRLLQNIE